MCRRAKRGKERFISLCLTEEGLSFELQDDNVKTRKCGKPSSEKIPSIFKSWVKLQLREGVQFCNDGYTSTEKQHHCYFTGIRTCKNML